MSVHDDHPSDPPAQSDLPPFEREGYKVLDSFSDPEDGDQLVLAQLLEHGADLSKARHVVHYFYFKTTDDRARAEILLVGADYRTHSGATVGGERPWSLIAERIGIVNEEKVNQERLLLTEVAEKHQGFYDGWEAQID